MSSNLTGIMIAGMARSGSTLMQLVLSKHNGLFTMPETHFYEELARVGGMVELSHEQAMQLLARLQEKQYLVSEKVQMLEPSVPRQGIHCDALFKQIMDSYRPTNDRQQEQLIWLEKTPGHLFHLHSVLSRQPDIKVVLTSRNAEDFSQSIMRTRWAPENLDGVIALWNESVRYIAELQKSFAERVLHIRYEDMVVAPETVMPRVFSFCGFEWREEFLDNVNENAADLVAPFELEWKARNLKDRSIMPKRTTQRLGWVQRMRIWFGTAFAAITYRQLVVGQTRSSG